MVLGAGPTRKYHTPAKILDVVFCLPSLYEKSLHTYILFEALGSRGGVRTVHTDPMQIWGPHKNCRIRIQESGSAPICIALIQLADPDHVRIRIYMHFSFLKIFDGPGSEDLVPVSCLI